MKNKEKILEEVTVEGIERLNCSPFHFLFLNKLSAIENGNIIP